VVNEALNVAATPPESHLQGIESQIAPQEA
jgi:hypothetical protein